MKATLVFLTLLGLTLSNGQPTEDLAKSPLTRGLNQDLEDFMKLIPTDKIKDLFYEYLNNDEEFGEAVEFLMSKEFSQFLVEIESMPEVRKMLTYLQNAGLDAYGFVNMVNKYLGIAEISPLRLRQMNKITGGLKGFVKDVKAMIPFDALKRLYEEKLKTSKDFAALVAKLSSPEFQSLVDKIMAKPKMQEIIKRLEKKNVDVQEILDLLTSMLGLKFPKPVFYQLQRNLKDDLADFMKLIPTEQIKDLFYEYMNNDEEFGEALEYILSPEFSEFVSEIESMPEVRRCLDYLQKAGLDAYGFVNTINKYLGLPPIQGLRSLRQAKITGGISGFIKDVKALLPFNKLKKLYEEKLKTSKSFADLVKRLGSPEFQSIVNKIMAKPKLQEIIQKLEEKNVNVQEILDLLTAMLGLKFPKPY